jgi:hypothetical protein
VVGLPPAVAQHEVAGLEAVVARLDDLAHGAAHDRLATSTDAPYDLRSLMPPRM